MLLYLARHATTQAMQEERFQGQHDYPLSAQGQQEALLLAARLQEVPLAAVYCSTLLRARDTAQLIAGNRHLPVIELPALREYGRGLLEGMTRAEVQRYFPAFAAQRGYCWPGYGQEPLRRLRGRARLALRTFRDSAADSDRLLLVSHAKFLLALIAECLGFGFRRRWPFRLDAASLSILELHPTGNRLLLLNDTAHLRQPLP